MITQEPEITRQTLITNFPQDTELLSIQPGDGTSYRILVVPFYAPESGNINFQAMGSVEDGGYLVVYCNCSRVAIFAQQQEYLTTGYVAQKFRLHDLHSVFWLTWLIAQALGRRSNIDNVSLEEFVSEAPDELA